MSDETTGSETTTELDQADALIKRIQRIATENGCTMQQAAWAIIYMEWSPSEMQKIPALPE